MEQTIIYKENNNLTINEELNFHKHHGLLTFRMILKRCLSVIIPIILLTVVCVFTTQEEMIPFLVAAAVIGIAFLCSFYKKNLEKSIVSLCKMNYNNSLSKDSAKKITLLDNGIEHTTPYSRMFIPYYDVEAAVSNRMIFMIRIKKMDKSIIVPKNYQNPDTLFEFDNVLREKLGDRFIYEM